MKNIDERRRGPQNWQIVLAVLACALFFGGCITQPQGVIINTKPTPTPTPVVGDPNNPKIIEVTLSDNTVPPIRCRHHLGKEERRLVAL